MSLALFDVGEFGESADGPVRAWRTVHGETPDVACGYPHGWYDLPYHVPACEREGIFVPESVGAYEAARCADWSSPRGKLAEPVLRDRTLDVLEVGWRVTYGAHSEFADGQARLWAHRACGCYHVDLPDPEPEDDESEF